MLVSLKEILKYAEAKKCAIGSFNTPNLEHLTAVIDAAEKQNMPVIIMHAQIHEEMGVAKLDVIGDIMVMMADKAKVPVCVHLDHGTDLAYLKKGLDIGFTSIMYDGSELTPEENYANTSIAVEMAARYGASVEAEIGNMGSREGGISYGGDSIYTDPDDAKDFVQKTGVDALACAFGTVHGLYAKELNLDFERLQKIHSMIDVPIVMHGGSGVSVEDYKKVITYGVRKINYYAFMAKAGAEAVKNLKDFNQYHDVYMAAQKGIQEDVQRAIEIFSMK